MTDTPHPTQRQCYADAACPACNGTGIRRNIIQYTITPVYVVCSCIPIATLTVRLMSDYVDTLTDDLKPIKLGTIAEVQARASERSGK